jgi:hypothetical protein
MNPNKPSRSAASINDADRPSSASPPRTCTGRGLTSSPASPGLRNRKSTDNAHLSHMASFEDGDDNTDGANPSEMRQAAISTNDSTAPQCQNIHEQSQQQPVEQPQSPRQSQLKSFWRTYDDIVILSLFSICGIVFRIFSATWFRSELGVVFSEDSALGTNLPLNCCSCFLLGLLCSGR